MGLSSDQSRRKRPWITFRSGGHTQKLDGWMDGWMDDHLGEEPKAETQESSNLDLERLGGCR